VVFFTQVQSTPSQASAKSRRKVEDDRSADDASSSDDDEGGDEGGDVKQEELSGDDDEDEWSEFQRESKKDSILETKSKETHLVHCPFFPSVRFLHFLLTKSY
jgi:translocation protein SEC63